MKWQNRFKKVPIYAARESVVQGVFVLKNEIAEILDKKDPTPEEQQKVLEWAQKNIPKTYKSLETKVASQIEEKVE